MKGRMPAVFGAAAAVCAFAVPAETNPERAKAAVAAIKAVRFIHPPYVLFFWDPTSVARGRL
jgi:hypothetical protein